MKAMILAAGMGTRMLPLTGQTPKPLLEVKGRALIEYHIEALQSAGLNEIVVNVHHLANSIINHVGDGRRYGVRVEYSHETTLLETAGGIKAALPLLGPEPFVVVSADIFTNYNYADLLREWRRKSLRSGHLVMVDNPSHHVDGDFGLGDDGVLTLQGPKLTYAGIALFRPEFFTGTARGVADDETKMPLKLRVLLEPAIEQGKLTGEHFHGVWSDVGTIERFSELNQ